MNEREERGDSTLFISELRSTACVIVLCNCAHPTERKQNRQKALQRDSEGERERASDVGFPLRPPSLFRLQL